MKKNVVLYANGTFDNKGCEAIARGAVQILRKCGISDISLCTTIPSLDKDVISNLGADMIKVPRTRESVTGIISESLLRMKMNGLAERIPFPLMRKIGSEYDYSFAMGGDNYCYPGQERFYRQNRSIRTKNSKNVFWACSIEEQFLNHRMMEDLKQYDFIFPRESLTNNLLKGAGIKNVIQCTDPAFVMEPKECEYELKGEKYIGVNISPLTMSYSDNAVITFKNIAYALKQLINISGFKVLLIPHVIYEKSDTYIHEKIKESIDSSQIVVLGDNYSAPELKYIIGNSEAFIGSRTHATIAAYSMCVPTFVLGYSVKAQGIAADIYGTADGHVISVQNGLQKNELASRFISFWRGIESEKRYLIDKIPEYIRNTNSIEEVLQK